MKKLFLAICAFGIFMTTNAQTLDRSIQPKPGPAPEINLKDAVKFTLDNGLKVFVVENHKMPIVSYSIMLDIHPELEGSKVGLHQFTGGLLTHGTLNRTKEQFNNEIDAIGGSIGAGSSSISGASLSKFQDKLLDLMSDALLHPSFPKEELDKMIKQAQSGLIASENDADNMLDNVTSVVNFGKYHPYGEVTTMQSIQNVKLDDVSEYYKTYFRPNVAYMAVVGDITPEQAKQLVTKYFSSWQKAEVRKSQYPEVSTPNKRTVHFVNRPGASQSSIAITYPIDFPIGNPDIIKTRAMNQILGGGSPGRLFQNLRERHGWTYGSYSSVSSDEIIGNVNLYAKSKSIATDSSIAEMLKEMDTIRNTVVDQKILDGVKNYMSGVFALQLESASTIARQAITIDQYNLPRDYYKNYLKNIAAITTNDVKEMANKYILPERANIVVVGNSSEVSKLKRFSSDGEIHYYDGYGNSVEPVEDKVINGKKIGDVLNMYIEAQGGRQAIEGLTDLVYYGDVKMGSMVVAKTTNMAKSPDKYLQSVYQPSSGQQQKIAVNGNVGYMLNGINKQSLPEEYLNKYKSEGDLQEILHPEQHGISYALVDMADVDGVQAYEVEKASNNGKDKALLYINAMTGELIKITENKLQGGLTDTYYSDYQEVKGSHGYKIPFKITVKNAQGKQNIEVRQAKANSGLKDNKFN